MKRIPRLFAVACGLLTLASAPFFAPACAAASASSASGGGAALDVNFFYDTLKDEGAWYNTTEYGDVWQPSIAYKNDAWRPYTDGYWTYTDGGWMFVSYEDFGWAVYHYGRWTHLKDIGWAWVPGTEWAPAWVSWRSSDPDAPDGAPADAAANPPPTAPAPAEGGGNPGVSENYIGWAPLPPEAADVASEDYNYGPTVDADYGIDPYDYNFVAINAFGAPWIGGVLFDRGRCYDCCDRSYNITRVYYNRDGGYRGVYAGGPNFDRLRGRTAQPLRQVAINRQTERNAGRLSQVNDRSANVFAPRFSRQSVGPNGRVKFNRQGALAKAAVLPGGQRGGGVGAEAQGHAREAFARQAQDFRQRNPPASNAGRSGGEQRDDRRGTARQPDAGGRQAERKTQRQTERQARTNSSSSRNAARADTGRRSRENASGGSGNRQGRSSGGGGGGRQKAVQGGGGGGGHRNEGGGGHQGGGGHGGGGGGHQGGGNGGGHGGNDKKH